MELDDTYKEVQVHNVGMTRLGFVVFLKSPEEDVLLPIFIGAAEAHSILSVLNSESLPRPLTHDLMKNALEHLHARITAVAITSLENNTFFARIFINTGLEEMDLDARPSDALALALRYKVPIRCNQDVLESAGVPQEQVDGLEPVTEAQSDIILSPLKSFEDKLDEKIMKNPEPEKLWKSPLDRLQEKLDKAVAAERYEEAAKIRDEMKNLGSKN